MCDLEWLADQIVFNATGDSQNFSNQANTHNERAASSVGLTNTQLESGAQLVMAGGNLNNSGTALVETTTTSATTTFVNDRSEKHQRVRDAMIDTSMSVDQTDNNSIGQFMAKPVLLQSLNWVSGDAANSVLGSYRVADYLTGGSTQPIWKNKISGYNLLRGTAILKVIVNAQPFQAGRLLVHFLPQEREMTAYSSMYVATKNYNRTTKTQQPCIEMDIQDGVATLEVPYVSPVLWYRRVNGFDWGTFYITVLSPLASAASTTVTMKVYMYFKDFECAAPIFGPEMNREIGKEQVKERRKIKEAGVVSTFFDAVAKPFDLLRGVPVIGTTTGVVADATKKVSEFFALFGWSRPLDQRGVALFKQHPQYQGFTFNGTNNGDVLALDSLNQVQPMENFAGSGIDEMSFSYLKRIPAFYQDILWSTSDASGAQLFTKALYPANLVQSTTSVVAGNTYSLSVGSPFVYLSRYFRYWRGSVVVTLKIVKTQFHAGRLQISYAPATGAGIPTTLDDEEYVYRDIIDVRDSDTYSFTLPYMHSAPFLNTGWIAAGAEEVSMGTLSVRVLNPLLASSTVASNVSVLVYLSAGEDFQLAALSSVNKPAFSPEMNTDAPRVIGPIADAPYPTQSIVPYALCTGEIFTSVKQLFQCLRPINATFIDVNEFATGLSIFPYITGLPCRTPDVEGVQVSPFSGDYLGELVPGFAYSRGGLRYCIPGVTEGNSYEWLSSDINGDALTGPVVSLPIPNAANIVSGACTALAPQAVRYGKASTMDVIVPHYGQTHSRLNYITAARSTITVPVTLDSPDYALNFIVPIGAGTYDVGQELFRSGADDFCTGYFLGFPPFLNSVVIA